MTKDHQSLTITIMRGLAAFMVIALSMATVFVRCNDNLRVAYQWKEIDFEFRNEADRKDAVENGTFIPANIIPMGIEVYKDRLFITMPRWKPGVPATLAYIDLNENKTQSPALKPYPSWSAHLYEPRELVSPFRIRADRCGRLWVLDAGIDNILGEEDRQVVRPPSLVVYDLHNDNLLRRFSFPDDQVKNESLLANFCVEDTECDNTYVYVVDIFVPALLVYSMRNQNSWRITHNFFHPDPLATNYTIGNISFKWDDGIFGIALSKPDAEGFATLYFHPLSSTNEFSVSTRVLRNTTYALDGRGSYSEYKLLGSRGPNGQSGTSFLDKHTGVLFYTLPNLNAVACWRTPSPTRQTNKAYNFKSQGRVYMSPIEMSFPQDVRVDDQDRLWILSNKLHLFMYAELNPDDVNFRVLTATVIDAIDHTACDVKTKPLPELIDKLGGILNPTTAAPKPSSGNLVTRSSSVLNLIALLVISFAAFY